MIEGWKEVRINEILTNSQINEVEKYVNKCKKEKIDSMSAEYIKELKNIFGKWRNQLLEKGADSDFLAYIIVNEVSAGRL